MQEQFVAAVGTLSSPLAAAEHRKQAEAWLLEFQRRDDCWSPAVELVSGSQYAAEVQTMAAQALKAKARMCRASPKAVSQHLQRDLLGLLQHCPAMRMQTQRQVVLALVATMLSSLSEFRQLLDHMAQSLSMPLVVMVLETLAEEVACLEPFGPGTSDERSGMVSDIKAALRVQAPAAYSWMAHVAAKCKADKAAAGSTPNHSQPADAAATSQAAAKLLACFQAWIRQGSLHEMTPEDSQSLVSMALSHLEDIHSPAFKTAGEVLAELLDHCPQEWLPALHEPIMRAGQLARQMAEAGHLQAVEVLSQVVSAYALLCINIWEPHSTPQSSASQDLLMQLALLPHVLDAHDESSDPVCWPALATWTQLAEYLMDMRVGEYEVFDDEEFFGGDPGQGHGQGDAQGNGQHHHHQQQAAGALGGLTTAGQMLQAQDQSAQQASEEVKALFEKLLCGLLNNLVLWQQHGKGNQMYIVNFTPTFTATLNDCLASCSSVLGPKRFTGLLRMLMDRPASDPAAPHAAGAAMHAVSAAGSLRLTSDREALQILSGIMVAAASQQSSSSTFLVPFCCAAASCCRPCLKTLVEARQDAAAFLNNTFQKASQGLSITDDSLDVHTPAAFTMKNLMAGAKEAGLPVPGNLVQALAGLLHQMGANDAAAEQALIVALSSGLAGMEGGPDSQHAAQMQAYGAITGPLHQVLSNAEQALQSKQHRWSDLSSMADQQLTGPLRRYSLLLQDQAAGQEQGSGSPGPHNQPPPPRHNNQQGFQALSHVLLDQLWPLLSRVLKLDESVSGAWLQPACRCLTLVIKAQAAGAREQLPSVLEVLSGIMCRPHGWHAAETVSAAFITYGSDQQMCGLLHQAASAVLGSSKAASFAELQQADKDPELAEALLKVGGAYMRYCWPLIAAQHPDQAGPAVAAVAKLAATCCCANHRAVVLSALNCLGSVLAAAGTPAAPAPPHVVAAVAQQANMLAIGLIGSLLAVSPLGRVHKVQSLLVDMSVLSHLAHTGGGGGAPDDQVRHWLGAAAEQFHLAAGEREQIAGNWVPAVNEVRVCGLGASKEAQAAGKKLKKLLRDFAELHSRKE